MANVSDEHELHWDGPFGRTYVVYCSCGWSASTFSDSREHNVGTLMDEHRKAVA